MDGTSQPLQPDSGLHEVAERLREAVRRHPRKMTLQLAREYGVPETEVIRAFPGDRAVEMDSARWEDLIRSFEALGPVRVLVCSGAATACGTTSWPSPARTTS